MISWMLLLSVAAPPDLQTDFTAANERALQGDLRGAIALYESLRERGINNADLLFNLGNAYAKNGQLVESVIAYERALRLAPGDADVQANLTAVRNRLAPNNTNAKIEAPDAPLTLGDALAPWVALMPSWLAATILLLGNGLFWAGWWVPSRRETMLITGAGAAVLGAGFLIAHGVVDADTTAIVKRPAVLREGPRPQFRETGKAPAGTRVRVLDDNGVWREVQRDNGTTGWIQLKDLAVL